MSEWLLQHNQDDAFPSELKQGDIQAILRKVSAFRSNLLLLIDNHLLTSSFISYQSAKNELVIDTVVPREGDALVQQHRKVVARFEFVIAGRLYFYEFDAEIVDKKPFNDFPAIFLTAPTALRRWKTPVIFTLVVPTDEVLWVAFEFQGHLIKERITSINIKELFFSTRLDSSLLSPGTRLERSRICISDTWINVTGVVTKNVEGSCGVEYLCVTEEHQEYVTNYVSKIYWGEKTKGWQARQKKIKSTNVVSRSQPTSSAGPTLMIVDSDSETQAALQKLFQGKGFNVVAVSESLQLKPLIVEKKPDLLLVKIQMTPLDGLTIVRRLKRDIRTWSVPIFMLSEWDNEEDVNDALEIGAIQVFSKPYNLDKLLTDVNIAVGRQDQAKPEASMDFRLLWSGDCPSCQLEIRSWAYLRDIKIFLNPKMKDTVRLARETKPDLIAFCSCTDSAYLPAVYNTLKNWKITKDIPAVLLRCYDSCKIIDAKRRRVQLPDDVAIPQFGLEELDSFYRKFIGDNVDTSQSCQKEVR